MRRITGPLAGAALAVCVVAVTTGNPAGGADATAAPSPAPSATAVVTVDDTAGPFEAVRGWLLVLLARLEAMGSEASVPAAQQALECDLGRSSLGSGAGYWNELPYSYRSPRAALEGALAEGFLVPLDGYRELEAAPDAVLYVFEARGEVKVAVRVVAVDRPGPGWRPERVATCRLAEFGRRADMGPGVWLWTNRRGRSMQERRLPQRCGGPAGRVLIWRQPRAPEAQRYERYYVRDPEGFFREDWQAPYLRRTTLPADARFTGYRRDGTAVWMAADGSSIYLVRGTAAQRWPRVARITCA